jgi:hypothetical protein
MRVIVQGLRALLIAVSCSKSLLRVTSGHRECRWPLRIKQTFCPGSRHVHFTPGDITEHRGHVRLVAIADMALFGRLNGV